VFAAGGGFRNNLSTTLAWVAAFGRVALRYSTRGNWSGQIALDGFVDLVRPQLQVTGAATPETRAFGALASLEVLIPLP
jgi:hypothetical protein